MTKNEFLKKMKDGNEWGCLICECFDKPEDGINVSDYEDDCADVLYRERRLFSFDEHSYYSYYAHTRNFRQTALDLDDAIEFRKTWWHDKDRPIEYMDEFEFKPNATIVCFRFKRAR